MKYRTKKACLDCGKPFYGSTDGCIATNAQKKENLM
jgi:hypothetical protein